MVTSTQAGTSPADPTQTPTPGASLAHLPILRRARCEQLLVILRNWHGHLFLNRQEFYDLADAGLSRSQAERAVSDLAGAGLVELSASAGAVEVVLLAEGAAP